MEYVVVAILGAIVGAIIVGIAYLDLETKNQQLETKNQEIASQNEEQKKQIQDAKRQNQQLETKNQEIARFLPTCIQEKHIEHEIAIVGSRAVGKTTLLRTLFNIFKLPVATSNLTTYRLVVGRKTSPVSIPNLPTIALQSVETTWLNIYDVPGEAFENNQCLSLLPTDHKIKIFIWMVDIENMEQQIQWHKDQFCIPDFFKLFPQLEACILFINKLDLAEKKGKDANGLEEKSKGLANDIRLFLRKVPLEVICGSAQNGKNVLRLTVFLEKKLYPDTHLWS
jgi:GTPase Era involved in 16S rRNA processing